MSSRRLRAVDYLVTEAIADGATPGAVVAVGRGGKLIRLRGYGRLDWDASAGPADASSIYDLASLTKVVGTTTAAMILVDEGRLDLDAAVVDYLPWWGRGGPSKAGVTVRHLLLPPCRAATLPSLLSGDGGAERLRGRHRRSPARVHAGRPHRLLRHRTHDGGVHHRGGDWPRPRRVPRGAGVGPVGDGRHGVPSRIRAARTDRAHRGDTIFMDVHVHGVVHDENAYAIGGVPATQASSPRRPTCRSWRRPSSTGAASRLRAGKRARSWRRSEPREPA